MEQQLLPEPVRLRMGADEEPGRRLSVDPEGRRGSGHGARSARYVEAPFALDADHRPRLAYGPGLRENLAALLRASGSIRGRFRPCVVQAHAPRHGPDRPLPRPARAEGNPDLAGPDPGGESSAGRGEGHRRSQGEDPGIRAVAFPNWSRPRGRRRRSSAAATSAAAAMARAFALSPRSPGTSTSRRNWPRFLENSRRSRRRSTLPALEARRFRLPTSSFSAAARRSRRRRRTPEWM